MKYFSSDEAGTVNTIITDKKVLYKGAIIQAAGVTQVDGKMVYFVDMENGSQEIADHVIQLLKTNHTLPLLIDSNFNLVLNK